MVRIMRKKICLYWMLSTLVLLLPRIAHAADLRVQNPVSPYSELVIEGKIQAGDFQKFVSIVRSYKGKIGVVYIFSPGGDFEEAMKIGRAMRALELSSMVPMRGSSGRPECEPPDLVPLDVSNCVAASAGFFIHIASVHRGGTFLAVHRPYFEQTGFSQLSEEAAKRKFDALQVEARVYMTDMGVPAHIQEDVLGTPSDKAMILDEKTIKTYFWGDLPARHEWVLAKCSQMSPDERQKYESHGARLVRGMVNELSTAEESEIAALRAKSGQESRCVADIDDGNRLVAFERYFNEKVADLTGYPFESWSVVAKDLGRPFGEISAGGGFESVDVRGTHILKHAATPNSPEIVLYDRPQAPDIVSSIVVYGPFPSDTFIAHLTGTLDRVWGKSMQMDPAHWRWSNAKFEAVLALNTAVDGRFLQLEMEEKK